MNIANFSKGETCKEIYSGLWQWDYGQVLRIQGLDLPTAVEIHFSLREKGGEAVTRVGTTKDGVTDVVIPDTMLENNGSAVDYFIYAFIYLTDETSGQTEYKIAMQVKARPKPEAFDSPEDAELFREAIAAVNAAADRAETAEKEAEGWAHGREDMPEKAEDNAKYYADKAAKDAEQTSADRKEVERLVESVSGIDEDVELVRGYKEAAEKAAENAATSAQASEESRKASETAKTAAEAAQTKAEEAARKTAEDRTAVEQAKTDVEGMKNQVAEDKTSIEQTVSDFGLTAQQAVTAINNAGQTQTERVLGAGNTAVQEIRTAKEQAVQSVEAAGTEQVQAVQAEGTTQIGAVQQKGQEVLDSIPEDFSTQMEAKLDKNQGEENSGKVLVVGGDGTVTPGETPIKVDSTLTQSGQAADAKTTRDTITALAIKNQASGEVPIVITDSAEYQVQDLGMEGRTEQQSMTGAQLLKPPKQLEETINEVEWRYEYGCVIANGSIGNISTNSDYYICGGLDLYEDSGFEPGTYSISAEEIPSEAGTFFYIVKSNGAILCQLGRYVGTTAEIQVEDGEKYRIFYRCSGDSEFNNVAFKIMLNSGSEAKPWEPYTGNQPSPNPDYPQEIINAGKYNEESQKWEYEVTVQGKNLIPFPYMDGSSKTQNGITFAVQEDGGVKVNGTATSTTYFNFCEIDFGDITMTKGAPTNGKYVVSGSIENVEVRYNSDNNRTFAMVTNGTTVNNSIIYPQVEYGTDPTTYEPYCTPQTVLLQSDRPLTKWDRLEKRDGQWGWVYKSGVKQLISDMPIQKNPEGTYQVANFAELDRNRLAESLSTHFIYKLSTTEYGNFWFDSVGTGLRFKMSQFQTAEEVKDWLQENEVYFAFPNAEETFVPLTESEQSALNALHTNYPTTVLFNDQGCEMSLEYVADTKNYIDQKIQESIQQSIAGNLLSINSNQSLSAPMGAALNLRLEALEAKKE